MRVEDVNFGEVPMEAPMENGKEKKGEFIDIRKEEVKVLGVSLERNAEAGPRVPKADKFADFSEDTFSLDVLQRVAKSVSLDHPLLLEGEAAAGKSYTIEYLAHLCNQEVYRMSLNGQTDTTDLIGKWVPRSATLRKRIEDLLKHPEKCQSDVVRRIIESRVGITSAEKMGMKEIAPEKFEEENAKFGLNREEMEMVATLEGVDVPEGDWAWQDGDIPKQMESGAWSVLDEVNTCEPQILVRLNALLEKNGQLVLSEDGSRVVNRHPGFRLFATVNPPGGRYKGRIPLSQEWISRWNYQNIGVLPMEIRAKRLMKAAGVEAEPVNIKDKLRVIRPEKSAGVPAVEGNRLADYYEPSWVKDLFTKYGVFAEKAAQMLESAEFAKDQLQKFDVDSRDDWRFFEYLNRFRESGKMTQVIKEALEYCIVNKCQKEIDRKKLRDLIALIKVSEPKEILKNRTAENQMHLQAAKNKALRQSIPEGHRKIITGETEKNPMISAENPDGETIMIDIADTIRSFKENFRDGYLLPEFSDGLPDEISMSEKVKSLCQDVIAMGLDQVAVMPGLKVQNKVKRSRLMQSFGEPVTKILTPLGLGDGEMYGEKPFMDPKFGSKEILVQENPDNPSRNNSDGYLVFYSNKPLFKQSKNLNISEARKYLFEIGQCGLTMNDYLVIQRAELEKNGDHRFDTFSKKAEDSQETYLADMTTGDGSAVSARWNPRDKRIGFYAHKVTEKNEACGTLGVVIIPLNT